LIIGVVSDVHGNYPALMAVLAHAKKIGIEQIWNLGDFVGYGPYPEDCVKELREIATINIAGNYDQKVLKVKKKKSEWSIRKTPQKWLAFEWAFDHLSKDSLKFLSNLPDSATLNLDNWRFSLVHGSPESNKEHLSPLTPENRLIELSQMAQAKVILCGHSHIPFVRRVGDIWFINPGSVGRMDDGDPRSSYAVILLEESRFVVTHYRIPYPVNQVVEEINRHNLPPEFSMMFIMGRNFDYIQELKKVSEQHIECAIEKF